jgi:hypothetical protein
VRGTAPAGRASRRRESHARLVVAQVARELLGERGELIGDRLGARAAIGRQRDAGVLERLDEVLPELRLGRRGGANGLHAAIEVLVLKDLHLKTRQAPHGRVGCVAHGLVGMDVVQDGDRPLDVLEGNGDGVPPIEDVGRRDLIERKRGDPVEGGARIGEHLPAGSLQGDGIKNGERDSRHETSETKRRRAGRRYYGLHCPS